MTKKITQLAILSSLFFPFLTHAAPGTDIFSFQQFVFDLLSSLTMLFWVAALAFFIFGVVKFIKNAEDSKEREKGKLFITWAIISFVVLVSLWGLVSFFADTLGIGTGGTIEYITD